MSDKELLMVCSLCGTAWNEPRQRGSCPGCGAGEGEMLRALMRDVWKMTPEVLEHRKAVRTKALEALL